MQVAHSGSFSEAARLLNSSQPVLSRAIRALEEAFGVRLFDRDTRHVRLTASGEILLPIVERLAADFDLALAEVEESFAGRRGRVVVGALPSMAATLLPGAVTAFRAAHPLVDLVIRDNISGSLYQQLLERNLDFALTTPPSQADDFSFRPLLVDPCVLVCRTGHALDHADAVDWKVFERHPFIALAPHSSVRVLTDIAFAQADVVVRPALECSQLTTVGALIERGEGVSAVPLSTVPLLHCANLAYRPLVGPRVERSIGIAHLKSRSPSPAAEAFLKHLLQAVCDPAPRPLAALAVA